MSSTSSPFLFTATAPTTLHTLSLHDALPISSYDAPFATVWNVVVDEVHKKYPIVVIEDPDRKSTRLNSSHITISYAVFCLKKKKFTMEILFHISHSREHTLCGTARLAR